MCSQPHTVLFPISRDPPEGGTFDVHFTLPPLFRFPISRDPPEGGTRLPAEDVPGAFLVFQFLGIPPKGELEDRLYKCVTFVDFPISRDPPEGGTHYGSDTRLPYSAFSNF